MRISKDNATVIQDLKDQLGLNNANEVIDYLLFLNESRTYEDKKGNQKEITSGRGKVEKHIKFLLFAKEEAKHKITATELRKDTGVDLNGCKDIIKAYQKEVDAHNEVFE